MGILRSDGQNRGIEGSIKSRKPLILRIKGSQATCFQTERNSASCRIDGSEGIPFRARLGENFRAGPDFNDKVAIFGRYPATAAPLVETTP